MRYTCSSSEGVAGVHKVRLGRLLVKEFHQPGVTILVLPREERILSTMAITSLHVCPCTNWATRDRKVTNSFSSSLVSYVHGPLVAPDRTLPLTLSPIVLLGTWCSSAACCELMQPLLTTFVAASISASHQSLYWTGQSGPTLVPKSWVDKYNVLLKTHPHKGGYKDMLIKVHCSTKIWNNYMITAASTCMTACTTDVMKFMSAATC